MEIMNKISFVPTISWDELCKNENANVIPIISRHLNDLEYLEWGTLLRNPNAIPILEKNIDKFQSNFFTNKNAFLFLEKNNNFEKYVKPLIDDFISLSTILINENLTNIIEKIIQLQPGITIKRFFWSNLMHNANCHLIVENHKNDFIHFMQKNEIGNVGRFFFEKEIWENFSKQKNIVFIYEQFPDKKDLFIKNLDWEILSQNENAISILEENPKHIKWVDLLKNKNAVFLIENNLTTKYPKNFQLNLLLNLASNSNAMHIFERYFDASKYKNIKDQNIWNVLCANPNAISLLEHNVEQINWEILSENPNAIFILEHNVNKIHWDKLAKNSNPNALNLIKNNINKLTQKAWDAICANPNAIDLIEIMEHLNYPSFDHASFDPTLKGFDFIEYANYNVSIFLKKHPDNIAIVLKNKDKTTVFLTKREHIKTTTTQRSNYLYACKAASNNYRQEENVEIDTVYFKFSTIIPHTNTFVDLKYIDEMMESTNGQVFKLIKVKELASVVSYDAFHNGPYISFWSTCKPGQGGLVYKLTKVKDMHDFYEDVYPQFMNKLKTLDTIKKKKNG